MTARETTTPEPAADRTGSEAETAPGAPLDPVAELEQAPDTDLVGDDTFVREPADTSDAGDVARAEASDIFDPEEQ